MNHGSLFSGGGGFDLAAEAMGWRNLFHCEKDTFCRSILKYYWPNSESIPDIKEFNAEKYRGRVDIITGGFPCQPFSTAGKRRGTEDDRYLWPEMLRVVRAISPRWVVAENVYGLINWNDGLVLGTVKSDLEAEGYEIATFVLPASGVNAPHQRYRVWLVGHKHWTSADHNLAATELDPQHSNPDGNGRNKRHSHDEELRGERREHAQHDLGAVGFNTADPHSQGQQGRQVSLPVKKGREETLKQFARLCELNDWRNWPTQPPVCSGDDGLPTQLDGIAFSKWRTQSVKMYGNAIVPKLALQIFKTIKLHDLRMHDDKPNHAERA